MSAADDGLAFAWCGPLSDDEMVELVESHGGRSERGWWDKVRGQSLGWVTARTADGTLGGFVNVAWDGSDHAFLIDTRRPDRSSAAALAHAWCKWRRSRRERPAANGSTSISKTTCVRSTSTPAASRRQTLASSI